MILTNYKRPNYYKDLIKNFTDGNKHFSFGVANGFSSIKFRWVADFLFKHRNNTHTNKHRAFISFFSNKDMALSEYGNILELQQDFPNYLDGVAKTKIPEFSYEFASRQYSLIGVEHKEFDEIDYIDASDRLFANDDAGTEYDITLGTQTSAEITTLFGDVNVAKGSSIVNWSSGDQFNSFTIPSGTTFLINSVAYTVLIVNSSTQLRLTSLYDESSGIKSYKAKKSESKRVVDVSHVYDDAPVFISMGYKFYEYTTGIDRIIWDNPPESVKINFDNFRVILNDDEKDLYTHPQFKNYIESTSTPITSGSIYTLLIGNGGLLPEESTLIGEGYVIYGHDVWVSEAPTIDGAGTHTVAP